MAFCSLLLYFSALGLSFIGPYYEWSAFSLENLHRERFSACLPQDNHNKRCCIYENIHGEIEFFWQNTKKRLFSVTKKKIVWKSNIIKKYVYLYQKMDSWQKIVLHQYRSSGYIFTEKRVGFGFDIALPFRLRQQRRKCV